MHGICYFGDSSVGIVMAFFARGSLARVCKDVISGASLTSIMLCVAFALQHMHAQGLLHMDLKPDNILIHESGDGLKGVVADFGLVRTLQSTGSFASRHALAGTFQFMAPEQLEGRCEDYRPCTDMYAFGVVMWTVITKKRPWEGKNLFEVQRKVTSGERLEFSSAVKSTNSEWHKLVHLAEECLSFKPADRPSAKDAACRLRSM